jgi:hypothetical protein
MATTAATQRRTFLRQLLIAVPLMPSFEGLGEGSGQDRLSSGWQTELVGADEPGERLVVSGQVLRQEGSAAPGVRLSVYHTDADGNYTRPVSDPRRARIHGSVLTDRDGRYAFHTSNPATTPATSSPRTSTSTSRPTACPSIGSTASCSRAIRIYARTRANAAVRRGASGT